MAEWLTDYRVLCIPAFGATPPTCVYEGLSIVLFMYYLFVKYRKLGYIVATFFKASTCWTNKLNGDKVNRWRGHDDKSVQCSLLCIGRLFMGYPFTCTLQLATSLPLMASRPERSWAHFVKGLPIILFSKKARLLWHPLCLCQSAHSTGYQF